MILTAKRGLHGLKKQTAAVGAVITVLLCAVGPAAPLGATEFVGATAGALIDRIAGIQHQVRQTQTELQNAREQQARFHAISLVSEHNRRLLRTTDGERQRYIAIILRTAEELSHRRTSPLERRLSARYLRLQVFADFLQGELRVIDEERRDLEGWLDIYQVPIDRMWDPDEPVSEAEDDDDDDLDIEIGSNDSTVSESDEDVAPINLQRESREHRGTGHRENDRNANDRDDER